LNATAIPGFLKYPDLVAEKKRISGSRKYPKPWFRVQENPGWKHYYWGPFEGRVLNYDVVGNTLRVL